MSMSTGVYTTLISNIIQERLRKYPHNSIIWSYCDLYQTVEVDGVKGNHIWQIEDILDNRKNDDKKCRYTNLFNDLREGKFHLKCLLCKTTIPYHLSSKSCSEMFTHLITSHSEHFGNYKKIDKKEYCSYSKNDDEYINRTHFLLASMLISTHSSFNLIENDFFVDFIKHINDKVILPSRNTLTEKIIPDMVSKIKEKIKNEISECESICLSIDGWSCNFNFQKFLSLTCHFLKGNQIISRVLKLQPYFESETSENLAVFIKDCVTEWNLERFGKLCILSDNANNIISAIEISGNERIGCCCHRFDLVIESTIKDLDIFEKLMKKCQRIAVKFKNSSKYHNLLYKVQEEIYGFTINVICESETRWFTYLDVMERIISNAQILNGILEAEIELMDDERLKECYKEDYILTESEIDLINFFIKLFNKMRNEAIELSSESICTLSYIIPSIKMLIGYYENEKVNLEETNKNYEHNSILISCCNKTFRSFTEFESSIEISKNEINIEIEKEIINVDEIKKKLIEKIIEKIDEKFILKNNIFENINILLATFLNPCFKMEYFEDDEENLIRNYFEGMNMNRNENEGKYSIGRVKRKERNKNEFEEYINEDCLGDESSFEDIMKYWESKKHTFPQLYKLSRKYLCYLCSSCSSERLFSDASNFYTGKRTRMLFSTVESQCIIRSYITNEGIELFFE